jgi:antitoxin component YwqK of YwqJK toxin-antitoxin module
MKNRSLRTLLLLVIALLFLTSCGDDRPEKDINGILLSRALESKSKDKDAPKLYKGDLYTGPVVNYYRDGTVEFKGEYKDGKKYGAWKYYHPDGKLKREETTQPSQGNYEVKTYRSTTGKLLTELIGKGEDTIHFKKYHHNGKLGQELQNNGTKIFKKWTSFGNLYHYYNEDSITITMDTKTREITEKGFFDKGKRTGLWFKRFPNGNIAFERNYKAGKLVGKSIEYFQNGNILTETNYNENGDLDGVYKQHFEKGGLLLKGQYKNGGKTGTWNYYNERGKLLEVENYQENRLNGAYEFYYANSGNLREKGQHKNGRKVGIWYYYDITGELQKDVDEGE